MRYTRGIFRRLDAAKQITLVMAMLATSSICQAQEASIAGRVGTLGLGGEASITILNRVGGRIGLNAFALSIDGDQDDVDYEFDVDLASAAFLADFYLSNSGFRVTAGLINNRNNVRLKAEPQEDFEIGDSTYSSVDVGNLTGRMDFDDIRPFLGIGIDTSMDKKGGLGFVVEIGALFQNSPLLSLKADGPIATDAEFLADLERERERVEDDISSFKVYPVLAFGISYHL